MQKYADYIESVEIESLWSGRRHVTWSLDRKVNILSGTNGAGKSTIINKLVRSIGPQGDIVNHMMKGVHMKVNPEARRTYATTSYARSTDRSYSRSWWPTSG